MAVTEDQLRTLLQDPAGAGEELSSADYAAIIAIETNVYRAAAVACRAVAAKYSLKTEVKAGPVTVKNQQKAENYRKLADAYDQQAREGGGGGGVGSAIELTGTSISTIDSNNEDSDRYAGVFSRGMHDNPSNATDYDDPDAVN